MMDYFAIYEPWKLITRRYFCKTFTSTRGKRAINIFVIPSAVMTLFNILTVIFPPLTCKKNGSGSSLIAYAFDWIFSFTMQIPIQLELETRKDLSLITELLYTNWFRYAADTIQFMIVCIIVWQLLQRLSHRGRSHRASIIFNSNIKLP